VTAGFCRTTGLTQLAGRAGDVKRAELMPKKRDAESGDRFFRRT
jgi:hypothetical protein